MNHFIYTSRQTKLGQDSPFLEVRFVICISYVLFYSSSVFLSIFFLSRFYHLHFFSPSNQQLKQQQQHHQQQQQQQQKQTKLDQESRFPEVHFVIYVSYFLFYSIFISIFLFFII